MENHSDSDTSSEPELDSVRGSLAESDDDETLDLESEPSKYYDCYGPGRGPAGARRPALPRHFTDALQVHSVLYRPDFTD
jgi:hypothetical protein